MMRKGVRLFSSGALAVNTRGGLQVFATASDSPPAASSALVSGAGTAEANRLYPPRGTQGGKTYYNPEGEADNAFVSSIVWDAGKWVITNAAGDSLYFAFEDVGFPWNVVAWEVDVGDAPPPTVTEA